MKLLCLLCAEWDRADSVEYDWDVSALLKVDSDLIKYLFVLHANFEDAS